MHPIFRRIRDILINPVVYFQRLKKETGIEKAFFYLLILLFFSLLMGYLLDLSSTVFLGDMLSKMYGFTLPAQTYQPSAGMMFLMFIVSYGMLALFTFVFAGLLHVWILLFGGKARYSKTYQLFVYSMTPGYLFGWIPFLGVVAMLYELVLLIIGTQKMHGIPRTRSIWMYVIPVVLFFLMMVVAVVFSIAILKFNPASLEMFKNMAAS